MDYWYDVETQYGVFFRWEYYEKPIGASALASIIENNPDVDSDWPELQAIIDTGFTLPSEGCVSSEEAYLYASGGMIASCCSCVVPIPSDLMLSALR